MSEQVVKRYTRYGMSIVEDKKGGWVEYSDYAARCQRLADELAIARRALDRIVQLCTTPHESKELFIRRVQSVIEWERAAQQDQPQ